MRRGFTANFVGGGAATASYQIEGAVREGGRAPSNWDEMTQTPGKIMNGDTGDVACDHYRRVEEDVKLMKEVGLNAYRFLLPGYVFSPMERAHRIRKGLRSTTV